MVKHVKTNACAVPSSFEFKVCCAVGKINQVSSSQVLRSDAKLFKRFLEPVHHHLQPVLNGVAAFNSNRLYAHLHGFFNSVCQQLIVNLVWWSVSSLNPAHGGFTNTRFQGVFSFVCPVLDCLNQRVVLAFVKEIAKTYMYADFVEQYA